jgi:hypothetical protein
MLSTPPDFIVETSDGEKVNFKAEHAILCTSLQGMMEDFKDMQVDHITIPLPTKAATLRHLIAYLEQSTLNIQRDYVLNRYGGFHPFEPTKDNRFGQHTFDPWIETFCGNLKPYEMVNLLQLANHLILPSLCFVMEKKIATILLTIKENTPENIAKAREWFQIPEDFKAPAKKPYRETQPKVCTKHLIGKRLPGGIMVGNDVYKDTKKTLGLEKQVMICGPEEPENKKRKLE